jgi:hypothetical protein
MEFRRTEKKDLEGIRRLYKVCFNLDMNIDSYNYWYLKNGEYCSTICFDNNQIVAHNAFITNNYTINSNNIKIAISSGGMVDSGLVKTPGMFLNILKYSINNYDGDAIIAFPNSKAEPFWTRILKFETICDNYFYIVRDNLNYDFNELINFKISRNNQFVEYRTYLNPKFKYEKIVLNDQEVIYKEYNGNIELVYINMISHDLIKILEILFNMGFERLNIINIYKYALEKIGFLQGKHNIFVYKWLNKEFENITFECQMIDSDVF